MLTWSVIIGSIVGGVVTAVVAPRVAERIMRRWPKHGKWAINLRPIAWPRRGDRQPGVRLPASIRQATWGGWTCTLRGCDVDKHGAPVDEPT